MAYTNQERLDIGRQIYHNELSRHDASEKYGISEHTARTYMRLYRDTNHLPPKNKIQNDGIVSKISPASSKPDLSEYEAMSKEELIRALVRSKINEARLKKGYEMKGAGASRTVTIYGSQNMK